MCKVKKKRHKLLTLSVIIHAHVSWMGHGLAWPSNSPVLFSFSCAVTTCKQLISTHQPTACIHGSLSLNPSICSSYKSKSVKVETKITLGSSRGDHWAEHEYTVVYFISLLHGNTKYYYHTIHNPHIPYNIHLYVVKNQILLQPPVHAWQIRTPAVSRGLD